MDQNPPPLAPDLACLTLSVPHPTPLIVLHPTPLAGILMYSCIILTVHLQQASLVEQWTRIHHAALWGSIALWWVFVIIYPILVPFSVSVSMIPGWVGGWVAVVVWACGGLCGYGYHCVPQCRLL